MGAHKTRRWSSPVPESEECRLDELFPSVNYLTLPDRFLHDAGERGRMGCPSGKCRLNCQQQEVAVTRRHKLDLLRFATRLLLLAMLLMCISPTARAQRPECVVPANAIVEENCRTDGVVDRTVWDSQQFGSPYIIGSIEGFANKFSVIPGETINFKIKAANPNFQLEIYRIGYYGGMGGRQIFDPAPSIVGDPSTQPPCARLPNPPNDGGGTQGPASIPDCWNWNTSATWAVPGNAASGLYLARLSPPGDRDNASHIPFVVREAPSGAPADVLYQFADATWQAYNTYDDLGVPSSFYNEARAVSQNRPWRNRSADGAIHGPYHWLFDLDLPLIRFLEANGISVGYAGSTDFEASSSLLIQRKVYLASGHEEYWSGPRRTAVENAAAAGTHLLFLAENVAYWKTRWQSDGNGDPLRVQVVYKEKSPNDGSFYGGNGQFDPDRNQEDWTGIWRDTRTDMPWTRPPTQPARSSNALTGVTPAAVTTPEEVADLVVPDAMTGLRIWRNTACAKNPYGCTLGEANVGFEMDLRADRYYEPFVGSQPPGLFSVTATTINTAAPRTFYYSVPAFVDVADYLWPSMTIELTLHRKPSGALVFSASMFRWSHGLDSARSVGNADPGAVSGDLQQATINLLADMGVQSGSLQPGLVAASASTDDSAPSSRIVELNAATGLITGTAFDAEGVVAGVEVSFDNGTTWHGAVLSKAAKSTSWSYMSVTPANVTPLVRAVDDSGNLEIAHGPDSPIQASQGLAIYSTGGSPPGSQQVVATANAAPGWTSIVPMNLSNSGLTDLLSYNGTTGLAVYSIQKGTCPGANCMQQVVSTVNAAPGWTSIVPVKLNISGLTGLLSYNAATGLEVYSMQQGPCPGPACAQQAVATAHAAPGWTSIVPMNLSNSGLTDLLSYNAATGLAVYSIQKGTCPGPNCMQQVVSTVNAAPGWTSIVPMKLSSSGLTDLLSYNAATGLGIYSIQQGPCPGPACAQQVVATANAAPRWNSVVPMNLNNDGLTDLLSYN